MSITIATGQEFSGKPKQITGPRLITFSGGPLDAKDFPRKNIHTDVEFAQSTGVPTRIASGTQYQGHLCELLLDIFGEAWLTGGTMTAKMVDIARDGDTLTAKAVATAVQSEAGVTKIAFDIWSERADGTKVMVGTATGTAS